MSHGRPSETCFSSALVRRGAGWLRGMGADADVVVSSRVRLARNIAGFPFVARATRAQRQAVLDLARSRLLRLASNHAGVQSGPGVPPAAAADPGVPGVAGRGTPAEGGSPSESIARVIQQMLWVDVHKAPALDRTLMVERHLISKEHARGPSPYIPQLGPVGAAGGSASAAAPEETSSSPSKDELIGSGTLFDEDDREGNGAGAREGKSPQAGSSKPAGTGGAPGGSSGEPRGVAISLPDETLSVMVNEEDHLRLQALVSGLELSAAYELVARVDDALELAPAGSSPSEGLRYAFSNRFGYLTACPTNVGTGIRASVMLHLPGLKLMGEMDKVRRATRDMSLAVRGYYGEGSEAAGEFFQISNQTTLGKSEAAIIAELERVIIPEIVAYERVARRLLMEKRRRVLEDKVFRALGALRHARLLTPEEAIMLLSDVRLGVLTGLIRDVGQQQVNQLVLLTQPAHLQRALGREMDQGERREARADLVRQTLSA